MLSVAFDNQLLGITLFWFDCLEKKVSTNIDLPRKHGKGNRDGCHFAPSQQEFASSLLFSILTFLPTGKSVVDPDSCRNGQHWSENCIVLPGEKTTQIFTYDRLDHITALNYPARKWTYLIIRVYVVKVEETLSKPVCGFWKVFICGRRAVCQRILKVNKPLS